MTLLSQVRATVRKHGLLARGDRVLAAVSGGADSVALLHVLRELSREFRFRLAVAHLNHGIRGKAADEDAAFVADLARRLRLPCVSGKRLVPRRAANRGISLEMAAREARYEFLAAAAADLRVDCVATAHTADDQAETIILRLARGAGSRGLGGIRYRALVAGMTVIRPMLDAGRPDVLAFLDSNGIRWREDESNSSPDFLRNRVRHEVLPFLEEKFGPGVRGALLRAAEVLREEDEWMDLRAREAMSGLAAGLPAGSLSSSDLAKEPKALRRRILRAALSSTGVPPELLDFNAIERVDRLVMDRRGSGGSSRRGIAELSNGWRVERRGHSIGIRRGHAEGCAPFRCAVCIPGETVLDNPGLRIVASVGTGVIHERQKGPGQLPARASLSLRALRKRKLYVRSRRPGDRIKPFGMSGSKKVQDILVDSKVPPCERERVAVFECGGEIVWIPGYRIASGWELENDTEPALHLEVSER